MTKAIKHRQTKQKKLFLEQLRKAPIVSYASNITKTSRSTFYRWKHEDREFSEQVDQAIATGVNVVNDIAESRLMSLIQEANISAIIFWLKHRHKAYTQKIDITAKINGISPDEIDNLITLLFGENSYQKGQLLLSSYVLQGKISEKFADFLLKTFLSLLKANETFSKKKEVDLLSEVTLRNRKV